MEISSKITWDCSDCPVCTMLRTLSGCSMLADFVRNSFTGRGDLSELCSQICRRRCDLQPLSRVIPPRRSEWSLLREPRQIMINSLAKTTLSLITTLQITFHIICINFQVVFFENNSQEFGTLNAVCEEITKLHIFIESRQENCLFFYLLFTFLGSLV